MADIFEKCRNFKDAKILMDKGIYGYFQPISSAQAPEIELNGKKLIMAGSNNYLGLANDPEMKKPPQKRQCLKVQGRLGQGF